MQCDKCGMAISPDETYEHAGQSLCEDCYLDVKSVPKTCDPWAVHSAKNTPQHQAALAPAQEQILALIREKGPITASEICDTLGIGESDFQRNFSTLRHMELAKGCKQNGQVHYVVF